MSENPPQWIVDRATETSEIFNLPFHQALQLEIHSAMTLFGYPLPERDPLTEHKRQKAIQNHRVLEL